MKKNHAAPAKGRSLNTKYMWYCHLKGESPAISADSADEHDQPEEEAQLSDEEFEQHVYTELMQIYREALTRQLPDTEFDRARNLVAEWRARTGNQEPTA
jgi:hypothetical protein